MQQTPMSASTSAPPSSTISLVKGSRVTDAVRPTPELPRPVDAEAAAAIAEGVRAVAEVADLALTATALLLRELQAKLPPAAASGPQVKA